MRAWWIIVTMAMVSTTAAYADEQTETTAMSGSWAAMEHRPLRKVVITRQRAGVCPTDYWIGYKNAANSRQH
jgi:hypothetical protein